MSPNTRQRRQPQPNMNAPPITPADDRIEKAKEVVNSPDLFKNTPEYIQDAWQELRQAYESTASESRPFPLWALDQFEHKHIENVIRVGYPEEIGALKQYAPSAREYFEAEPWRFILFFNSIEQGRARALNNIMKSRERFSFKQLYKEVQHNRRSRIQGKTNARTKLNAKSEFLPSDFRACCNESSSSEDGSDAEFSGGSDDEEGGEVTEEDIDSEPDNIVWSPENPAPEREIDYVVGLDAHMSGDQGPEERDCAGDESNCPDILNSYITIQDDTEDPDQADTINVTTTQIERRDTNPGQPSVPNVHPDNVGTLTYEDQVLRDGPATLNKLKELKAEGEAAEKNIKNLDEKIIAKQKELRLILESGLSTNVVSKIDPLYSDLKVQDGKRKIEEENKADTERKKAKLLAQFNSAANQFEAQVRTNIQRHEAASE